MELITVKVFDNAIEAHILKSRLESEGIVCFIFDDNMVSLNPLYNVTLGGIKLKVREVDVEHVNTIIDQIDSLKSVDDNDQIIKCPNCDSTDLYTGYKSMKGTKGILSAIVSFLFMVFPIYYKTVYKCKVCGDEFRRE
ncbi:DUF2007 domain-containing protein [Pseudopedobacter sp.]|uniref:putative signal transducing protein n=1 Tax=Pseudopedobacter sp. TaxID=1936787 RepID=UPI003341CEC0